MIIYTCVSLSLILILQSSVNTRPRVKCNVCRLCLRIRRNIFSLLYVSLGRSTSRHVVHVLHVCNSHSALGLNDWWTYFLFAYVLVFCAIFTRVKICRTLMLMNEMGLIIQIKSFVSELRQHTLWKTKDEDTFWQWILESKPSAVFTHSQTARSNMRNSGGLQRLIMQRSNSSSFLSNHTFTERHLELLWIGFVCGESTLHSRVADQPDILSNMWKLLLQI